MALHNPPYYRYPLLTYWDKEIFRFLSNLPDGILNTKIAGTVPDKDQLIITLIRSQKALHDWRALLKAIFKMLMNNQEIYAPELNTQFPTSNISTDIPAWVTYEEDKIVNEFIDSLATRKLHFSGTDKQIIEFILRFTLGQLGNGWEETILMIWELVGDAEAINLSSLNNELKSFDYLNIMKDL